MSFSNGFKSSVALWTTTGSVEQRLISLCSNSDTAPAVEDLIQENRNNPRNSVIARIGLVGIGKKLVVMQTQLTRWQQDEHAYTTRIQESITEEQRLLPALDAAHGALEVASQDHHNLVSVKQNQIFDDPPHFRRAPRALWAPFRDCDHSPRKLS
jgi:hypothetical protein